jgi:hypothetical protein
MNDATEFERRRNEVVVEIISAFGGVSREDGTTLHEAIALDDCASPDEQRAARSLDVDGRWQDVPDAEIWACNSALSFVDEKGFRYYIPAFMTYALRHWEDDEDGYVLSACMYHLLHERSKSLRQSDPASIAGRYNFTGAQSKAVTRFLRFVIDFGEFRADEVTAGAVQRWERFCNQQ